MSKVLIPRLVTRFEKTGLKGAIVNVSQFPEVDPQTSIYAASKALTYTYGLGIHEQYGDKVDILTAIPKAKEEQAPGLDSTVDTVGTNAVHLADIEKKRKLSEHEPLKEFEYVPLQMLYS